jgi:hypothetical protein
LLQAVDLGELEIPEPPLLYQAKSEELDLFLDSADNVEREVPKNSASKSDATSAMATRLVSLVGAWTGTYSHREECRTNIFTSFSITNPNADGTFEGAGADPDGTFTMTGTLKANKADFVKLYAYAYKKRRYIGTLDTETGTIVGKCGPLVIATAEFDSVTEDGGTFSLARQPVGYFLYRPSEEEFQESRPKALWKMVRNAAKQWYRSRHLIWDVLRERRDQRNEYVEIFLRRADTTRFYNPTETSIWATIIHRTDPNDLRLWRLIAQYKQHRTIRHWYVRNTK